MTKDQKELVKGEDIPQEVLAVRVKDESLQEAIKWTTYLFGEKLEEHKLISNVLIRRYKPLTF